jgi:methionyl-tRNA synthetase
MQVNSELLANFGNFASRAFTFLATNFGNVQPPVVFTDEDRRLVAAVDAELTNYRQLMAAVRLRDAVKSVLAVSRLGNQYMQATEPWRLVKGDGAQRLPILLEFVPNI